MKTLKVLALALGISGVASLAQAADNVLTPAEKAGGWQLLWDGKSTAGWRGFKTPEPDAGWQARDGALSPDPKTSKDIMTNAEFENFELAFDWKISPKGNSGVMFHVLDQGDETYWSGPEYQIVDNARGEGANARAAALFALYAVYADRTKPVGEFNTSRLVVNHGRVQHWLNGQMILEYNMDSDDFRTRVAASKFKQWPIFATGKTGHIALQNHGDAVAFKNLKIRVLK